MAKISSIFVCQQCGYQSPNFLGKCPECGTWNSLVEQVNESQKSKFKSQNLGSFDQAKIIDLSKIEKRDYLRVTSKIGEFDRVLGGGIVPGSLVLIAGDPGIGKSTLLSQTALNIDNTLYIAGEESPRQIKLRIERIKKNADLKILNEVDIDLIIQAINYSKPGFVIVDSIQTLETLDLQSAPGSVGQVRECAHRLQRVSKELHIPIFLVGHVTKEGTVAGPKTLEHLVDVVLSLEGEQQNQFRVLRATKNRFGSTDEVGIFEMKETGMEEVKNPSRIFLSQKVNAPGSVVVSTLNGLRPMLLEIQALVTKSNLPIPRRVGTGIDNNRLQLLVAVLTKRLHLNLFDQDVFVLVTGGIRVTEPAADLAICMAIISSFKESSLKPKTALCGEVGLLGEIRTVRSIEKRESEAKRLGFDNFVSPNETKSLKEAINLSLETTRKEM